jgi:hypothetical protein
MKKVVYLLGAGASADALPVVNEISDKIDKAIKILTQEELSDQEGFPTLVKTDKSQKDYQKKLTDDLLWLKTMAHGHATIDTYAKKLFLVGDTSGKQRRLKIALSAFFAILQMGKMDRRYDTFLASILNNKTEIPKNIFILSWNYDQQMEFALEDYNHAETLKICENAIMYREDCFLYKLNGSAALYNFKSLRRDKSENPEKYRFVSEKVEEIVRNYAAHTTNGELETLLSFAWEEDLENILDSSVLPKIEPAEILVVIGYSFPFFNREIDRRIINAMPNLKTIYFQDKYPINIIDRFQSISTKKIRKIPYSDTEQFCLPPEL